MEKRQLNFNAPLLSVRRYSSPTNSSELVKRKVIEKPVPIRQQSLPLNQSDWEIEVVTKPAAVPFHWEQIPGKPKDEVENSVYTPEEPSNTPRLPPARISEAIRRNSGEISRLPPGRLSSGPSRYNSGERSCEQSIFRPQIEAFSFSDHASLLEKLSESLNCGDSNTESEDDAYSDALDTLSRTESSSFNYSVSGLSGYQSSGVKPSGTFSVDAQTRDFMMNRFLPAAKAAVLETPQYAVKKPSVVNELPKQQIKKVISVERKPILDQYDSVAMPYYSQYTDNVESEDEEQECSIPAKKSGKVWGILPRFCVKNSLCLFNPLPGMKLKGHAPSSAGEVRKLTRKAHSGPLDKNTCHVPQKKKFHSGLLSRDLPEIEKKLASDSNQFVQSRDLYKSGMSPLRCNRSRSISPYRNESPKSPFREGVGFLGMPKQVENYNAKKIASSRKMFKALQDVSRNQINERGSGPPGEAVEKTLYVDFVNKTNLPVSKLSHRKAEAQVGLSGGNLKVLADRRQTVNNRTVKSSVQETSIPITLEEGKKMSPISRSTDKVPPSSCVPKPGCVSDGMENAKSNRSPDQESRPLACTEMKTDVKFGLKDENTLESDDQREFDPTCLKSPLPPPLPKSPSESWLWRTLPSISLGKPFSHPRSRSPFHSKKGQKGSNTDTKWETIVKTSNLRHDHVHYSEELIPHVSRRQNKS